MKNTDIEQEIIISVTNKKTGKEVKFRKDSDNQLTLLHPETMEDYLSITISEDGKIIPSTRTPEDAGKCLLYCAEGCNGSLLCVAGCAAECATIII